MEIVKATSAAEFLSIVPTLAGGSVERSIVFVPFRGNRTFPAACRIDLPSRERRADLRALVHGALGVLSRIRDADRVDVVVYTDRSFEAERGIPHLELGRAAVEGLRRAGFHVGFAGCVASDGWGDYLDRSHADAGRPLDEISVRSVDDGSRDREVPDADTARRLEVARLLALELPPRREDVDDLEHEVPLVELLEVLLESCDAPELVAVGLKLFASPAIRDAAILSFAFGRDVGHLAMLDAERWGRVQRETGLTMDEIVAAELESGAAPDFAQEDLLLGRTDLVPDRERLGAAIRLLRTLVAHAPDELRPGPLTMLGWFLWAVGSVSAAGAMLERALTLDPGYRMASILLTWFDSGALPEWLFRRLE
jgi:hypothetical protein